MSSEKRQWQIINGPAEVGRLVARRTVEFTCFTEAGQQVTVKVTLTQVSHTSGSPILTFRGNLYEGQKTTAVIGRFHTRDRSGDLQDE